MAAATAAVAVVAVVAAAVAATATCSLSLFLSSLYWQVMAAVARGGSAKGKEARVAFGPAGMPYLKGISPEGT